MSKRKEPEVKKEGEQKVVKFVVRERAVTLAHGGNYSEALLKVEKRIRSLKKQEGTERWTARKSVLLGKSEALRKRIKELQSN